MKDKIRPIYFELQGYLSQAPGPGNSSIFEEQVWIQYNKTIDELEEITSKQYSRYRINPAIMRFGDTMKNHITIQAYRTILGGLISRLHGEYFPDEISPITR